MSKFRWYLALAIGGAAAVVVPWALRSPLPANVHPPPRGAMIDVLGRPLTAAATAWRAAVNLQRLRQLERASAERFLAALCAQLGATAIPQLDSRWPKNELHLGPRVDDQKRTAVTRWLAASEWHAEGPGLLRFIAMPERLYPHHQASAPLVGMVNVDGVGIEGLELRFDGALRAGETVRLTIDIDQQARISALLEAARIRQGQEHASAVVIDLAQQTFVAVASVPGFDPAKSEERMGPQVRLRAATSAFQAGPMLEPFLLQDPQSSRAAAGPQNALGRYEMALEQLAATGLLGPPHPDFPGAIATLVRRQGTETELLRDLANGAGIAPSLLQYSTSLAGLISGIDPRAVSVRVRDDAPGLAARPSSGSTAAARHLREVLIERARGEARDSAADFGGLWAVYRDRTEGTAGVHRAVLALFTPADAPTHLVTIGLEGTVAMRESDLLILGRDVLATLMRGAGPPPTPI